MHNARDTEHTHAVTPSNVIPLRPAPTPQPVAKGRFVDQINELAAMWAAAGPAPRVAAPALQQPLPIAEVIAFRSPGTPAPCKPPKMPHKPPANYPPRTKPARSPTPAQEVRT